MTLAVYLNPELQVSHSSAFFPKVQVPQLATSHLTQEFEFKTYPERQETGTSKAPVTQFLTPAATVQVAVQSSVELSDPSGDPFPSGQLRQVETATAPNVVE